MKNLQNIAPATIPVLPPSYTPLRHYACLRTPHLWLVNHQHTGGSHVTPIRLGTWSQPTEELHDRNRFEPTREQRGVTASYQDEKQRPLHSRDSLRSSASENLRKGNSRTHKGGNGVVVQLMPH
jgi:hypothetical protein